MPTYMYKAVNKSGLVVRNRVESASRQGLIKMLKNNHLMPIEIQQVSYISKRTPKKPKKNVTNIQEIMKNVTGEYPILILDDVFSELDENRRKKLIKFTSRCQTFLTTTDESLCEGKIVRVEDGKAN